MEEDNVREIFCGHIEECLGHLNKQMDCLSGQDREKAVKLIVDFCQVTTQSVKRWLIGKLPVGESLIKLMCFLDISGYRVIEFERVPKVYRNFAELIGFGLISSDDAARLLGYARASNLHPVLLGHQGTSKDKGQKMWDIWKEKRTELTLRKEKIQQMPTPSQTAVVCIIEGLLALLDERPVSESELVELKRSEDTLPRLLTHLSNLSSQLTTTKK